MLSRWIVVGTATLLKEITGVWGTTFHLCKCFVIGKSRCPAGRGYWEGLFLIKAGMAWSLALLPRIRAGAKRPAGRSAGDDGK
jgi:hypothetical protein